MSEDEIVYSLGDKMKNKSKMEIISKSLEVQMNAFFEGNPEFRDKIFDSMKKNNYQSLGEALLKASPEDLADWKPFLDDLTQNITLILIMTDLLFNEKDIEKWKPLLDKLNETDE